MLRFGVPESNWALGSGRVPRTDWLVRAGSRCPGRCRQRAQEATDVVRRGAYRPGGPPLIPGPLTPCSPGFAALEPPRGGCLGEGTGCFSLAMGSVDMRWPVCRGPSLRCCAQLLWLIVATRLCWKHETPSRFCKTAVLPTPLLTQQQEN